MSDTTTAATVYRKDYLPPAFWVDQVELEFDLDPTQTTVRTKIDARRNTALADASWVLDGEGIELKSISVDGVALPQDQYQLNGQALTLDNMPDKCVIETVVVVNPEANKALSGLYRTSGNFCTQCEAQGFRRITFFPDRPDVMSRYKVTIRGSKSICPVMLSNGNRVGESDLGDGRHEVIWEDPHPKPSYLFALVAGDLKCHRGSFTTIGGRKVALEIWVEERNLDQCEHACISLQKSMRWDEEVFGLEYDLDIYMIVAVDDFNMGAMENKGLNVFNSKYVLAASDTATDDDFLGVEAVIAHEYFHNWTGNRVTCRDWFQLTLKEGLTVFRDQQFTTDQTSAAVKRIDDVVSLRGRQFAEDSGPMAHPIRPESYIAMDNFYTATVYDKGAEIIRMYHTMLGAEGFRKGMDLYFQRHDNQAVTCDDFRNAMADANQVDLSLMDRWYSQPGTPELSVESRWMEREQQYVVRLCQSYPKLPDSIQAASNRLPVPLPIRTALLDQNGNELPLHRQGHESPVSKESECETLLMLEQGEQEFVFTGVQEKPTLSILRGFSAPVRLTMHRDDSELAFLMGHDRDTFNRWDAGQTLAMRLMKAHVADDRDYFDASLPSFLDAVGQQLDDDRLDGSFLSLLLTLPSEATVGQELSSIDPERIHAARQAVRKAIGTRHDNWLQERYQELSMTVPYSSDQKSVDGRRLKNTILNYLMFGSEGVALAAKQFDLANNMTDRQASLRCLSEPQGPEYEAALGSFYEEYSHMPLVIDKWFAVQAASSHPDTLQRVLDLANHEAFVRTNPNRVRSLLQVFTMNQVRFHRPDGSGYRFLADFVIEISGDNPQLAARLVSRFNDYRRMELGRQNLMRAELERIDARKDLSKDVREIVGRALNA